ncbi:MAG: NADH:ubiquinone reductase (Na(+)-transporting) subunit F [Acidimicrobiia bacterium]
MTPVHEITVLPANLTVKCSEDETILDAAIRSGFALPYGCRKGHCSTCKAQVLDGEVDLEVDSIFSLSDFEREQGFTLLCSAYPVSDATIEIEGLEAEEVDGVIPAADHDAVVTGIRPLTHDIRWLQVETGTDVEFRAGQFAQLSVRGTDVWRSYSMANPSSERRRHEFMIKLVPGGQFSARLEGMEPGQALTLNGPHGTFWVRDRDRPLLMVGGGAGMAPLWGMLRDLAERGDPRPVRFFYGARTAADLFHLDEIAALAQQLADFRFVSALSDVAADGAGGHEPGLVTDVVDRHLGRGIADHDAYLCGPPPMIDAALELLAAYGLEERRHIHYDKFTAS